MTQTEFPTPCTVSADMEDATVLQASASNAAMIMSSVISSGV
jgi:hypothetical protein